MASADDQGIRVRIVGPAAPEGQTDGFGPDELEEYQGWQTMREVCVKLAKRFDLRGRSGKKSGPKPRRRAAPFPPSDPRARKRPGRSSIRKDAIGDDYARAAPSTTGSDQDIDSRTHDFVDDVLDSPYPMDVLASLHENSGPLRRNVDAMAANVDGFGYQLEPVLDFSHPKVADHIRDLMFLERVERDGLSLDEIDESKLVALEPNPGEVEKRRRLWERLSMCEHHLALAWLESLNPESAFTQLRILTRQNLELFGNAAWEVLRAAPDPSSPVTQIYNVPFSCVRLMKADKRPTKVKVRFKKSAIEYEDLTFMRFFRRYVRVTGVVKTYYKELGDPRTVSRRTGRQYESVDYLREEEGEDALPANELYHWRIDSLLSPYGIPRWTGALLAVLGNRAAEEVNYLYFDNKAIPPMILLVSGGRLSEDSVHRIQTFLEERLKGRENFWKVLVVEGVPASAKESGGDVEPSGKLRLEVKPLMGDMGKDGLFADYDAANELKIGRSFRIPPLLTGDQRDANRSTSDAVMAVAEAQVFQPARDQFDSVMNRLFFANRGYRFWTFRTNAPVSRFPNDLVENAAKAANSGLITPNEGRALLGDAFSKKLPHRSEDWAQIPPKLADAAAREGALPSTQPIGEEAQGGEDALSGDDSGDGSPAGSSAATAAAKGDLLARGRTSEEAGHSHPWVALRDGDQVRVVSFPGGEDGHVHPQATASFRSGSSLSLDLRPVTSADGSGLHGHLVELRLPLSRRQKKVQQFALAMRAMRAGIRQEVEAAKDDFFSPTTWKKDEDGS